MIIFYNKQTGKIIGTIEGRLHGEEQLKMWVGERTENNRLIFEWKKNEEGIWRPNVEDENQKLILEGVDKDPASIYNFGVDLNKETLVKVKE